MRNFRFMRVIPARSACLFDPRSFKRGGFCQRDSLCRCCRFTSNLRACRMAGCGTPGLLAYGDDGYYWVPGTWVPAPHERRRCGRRATGAGGTDAVVWHGMTLDRNGSIMACWRESLRLRLYGHRICGGMWAGGAFRYNTAVMHVNTTVIHNTYVDRTIVNATPSQMTLTMG